MPIAFLVLFLVAGSLKGAQALSWLPIDLTLMAALVVVAAVVLAFIKAKFAVPRGLGACLIVFGLIFPTLMWTDMHAYAVEKATRFFTLTLLAALAPCFLVRSTERLRVFIHSMMVAGGVLAAQALLTWFQSGSNLLRLSAMGSDTIALGRGAATSLLWVAILTLQGRVNAWVGTGVTGVLGAVCLASGARGPLLSAVAVLLLVFFFFVDRSRGSLGRLTLMGAFTVGGVALSMEYLPQLSLVRVSNFLNGSLGYSELWRLEAFGTAFAAASRSFFGTGLGGFASISPLGYYGERLYPHNILLETILEGGWLAGAYLAVLMLLAIRRAFHLAKSRNPELVGLFSLLLFYVLNAMVSGDLNDNRVMFALVAITLAWPKETQAMSSTGEHQALDREVC